MDRNILSMERGHSCPPLLLTSRVIVSNLSATAVIDIALEADKNVRVPLIENYFVLLLKKIMSLLNEQKRAAVIARINRLTPESKAVWGKMNISEMLCHCTDGLKMATGELAVADKSNFFLRTVVKPLIVYALPMPKGAPTANEINPQLGGTKPDEFEKDRRAFVECLEKFGELPENFSWAKHPIFGKMNRKQWGLLGHKHIDHHLKQFGV